MSGKVTREIDRFKARSDDGTYATTIIVYRDFVDGHIPGMREARTVDGHACNRIDDNTFQIVRDPLLPHITVRRIH